MIRKYGWVKSLARVGLAIVLASSLLISVAGVASADPGTLVWTLKSPMLILAPSGAAAVGGNGRVYRFGGTNPYMWTNQEYDPASNSWRSVANMPTGRCSLAGAAGTDGKLYAIGGWGSWGWYTGAMEAYDPATNSWASKTPMNYPRQVHSAATGTDGIIYAIGGTYYEPYIALNIVEAFNPATNTWTTKTPMPSKRWLLAAVGASNGKIYAIGGYDGRKAGSLGSGIFDPAGILGTVEEYDPVSNTWTTKAPMPTPRTGLTAVATPDGKIYAIGGFYGSTIFEPSSYLATVEVYDTSTNTWTTETPMTTPRFFPQGAIANGVIYVIGGYTSGAQPLATMEAATSAPAQVDTTTSVVSSQNPSAYGQPVTFTATVSAATGMPTGTVQFKIDGADFGAPVALSGGSAVSGATALLAIGERNVSAVYSGDASFNGSTSPGFTQTVNKAPATVTLGNLNQVFTGSALMPTATTNPPGLEVTWTGVPQTNTGNYQVTATVQDANYQGSASGELVIARADQTITFGALNDKAYGDADFAISATASSELTVSFTASGAGTVSSNIVHITGAGSCTITAHQNGDANYNAAPDVSQSFTVKITYDGLGSLVQQFVTKAGVANSLLTKLDNAKKAEAKGNDNAKAGMIGAFINEVQAQTGKAISAENAAILIAFARNL